MMPLFLDAVCPWHPWILNQSWQLFLLTKNLRHYSDNVFLISSQALDTDAFSAGFRWRLFVLASLSFGISFSWDFILDSFSRHPVRLTPLSLVKKNVCAPFLVETSGCFKSCFTLRRSVFTSPLSWGGVSFSSLSLGMFLSPHPF